MLCEQHVFEGSFLELTHFETQQIGHTTDQPWLYSLRILFGIVSKEGYNCQNEVRTV